MRRRVNGLTPSHRCGAGKRRCARESARQDRGYKRARGPGTLLRMAPGADHDQDDDSALPSRVIAIGASAGGLEPLQQIVGALPADFPAAVCVVLHIPATGRSMLAAILDRATELRARVAEDGMTLRPGHVYVAPADHHLLVDESRLALHRGPKQNGSRPAVDPLFRSIARSWGPGAVGVVLSGALDDGSSGAISLVAARATLIVQEPADALVSGMPEAALAAASPHHVVPARAIPDLLIGLADKPVRPVRAEVASPEPSGAADLDVASRRPSGPASRFTCPECSGALWQVQESELARYRCRVGHVYSEETLIDRHSAMVEAALWTALEALEERAELLERVATRLGARNAHSAGRMRAAAEESTHRAGLIRRALSLAEQELSDPSTGTPAG